MFDTAADAFAAGWMILQHGPHPLLGSIDGRQVTDAVYPLDTRMVHYVCIDGAPRNAIRLDGSHGSTDHLFRRLLAGLYGRTAADRVEAKQEAFMEALDAYPEEIADAYKMLELVRDKQCQIADAYDGFDGDDTCRGCGAPASCVTDEALMYCVDCVGVIAECDELCAECVKEMTSS